MAPEHPQGFTVQATAHGLVLAFAGASGIVVGHPPVAAIGWRLLA
jgi:hypothetical protein